MLLSLGHWHPRSALHRLWPPYQEEVPLIFRQLNIHCPLLGIRRTFAFWSFRDMLGPRGMAAEAPGVSRSHVSPAGASLYTSPCLPHPNPLVLHCYQDDGGRRPRRCGIPGLVETKPNPRERTLELAASQIDPGAVHQFDHQSSWIRTAGFAWYVVGTCTGHSFEPAAQKGGIHWWFYH